MPCSRHDVTTARDLVEERRYPHAGLWLEAAPRQRQAQEVEPERRHARHVVVGQVGDGLERRAAIVEGDVEQAGDARVDAAQDHHAAVRSDELATIDVERRVARRRRRAAGERREHGDERQQRGELHAAQDSPDEAPARIPRTRDRREQLPRER